MARPRRGQGFRRSLETSGLESTEGRSPRLRPACPWGVHLGARHLGMTPAHTQAPLPPFLNSRTQESLPTSCLATGSSPQRV